jgi:putative pyruvate formate lyase activating enzyme
MQENIQKKFDSKYDKGSTPVEKYLECCILCPHKCKVNRLKGEKGFCGAPAYPVISSAIPHHGEEPPISGTKGSGTVFFSYCNMKCVYCQNYQISQEHETDAHVTGDLVCIVTGLRKKGCHNINFVSPTIWIPYIAETISGVKAGGSGIPFVYNTGGYELISSLKLLKDKIDIYMPDIRYSNDEMAEKYSGIKDYVKYSRLAVKEMFNQVGNLCFNKRGTAKRGLLLRLLVLPENIAGVKETLEFIRYELSADVYLSIMAQYSPEYKAKLYPELSRGIYRKEYLEVTNYAEKLGLVNGWTQDYLSLSEEDLFKPDFNRKNVFKFYE